MKLRYFLITCSIMVSAHQNYAKVHALEEFPEGLDTLLAQHRMVVVKIYMTSCPPCAQLKPVFAGISDEFKEDDILFLEVNIQKHRNLAAKYGIRSVPTILYFSHNRLVGRHTGFLNSAALRQEINTYFAS